MFFERILSSSIISAFILNLLMPAGNSMSFAVFFDFRQLHVAYNLQLQFAARVQLPLSVTQFITEIWSLLKQTWPTMDPYPFPQQRY
jgi:hypothetical protein